MKQDSAWKEVVEDLFERFLFFFVPRIHKNIDFSKGYEFLEQELKEIIKHSKTGKRHTDKLAKVYLKDGSKQWLLIHIEIQGYKQKDFPERMYVYNYRIFDRFRKEVISLALLTDPDPKFRPNQYRRSRWGFAVTCRYPLVKIIDYRKRVKELEKSANPFAIIVRAYLKTLEVAGNVQKKYSWKKRFLLELYQMGLKKETLLAIYKFIDLIMELPAALDTKINEKVKNIEEAKKMPYITFAERYGRKEGRKEGRREGRKAGVLALRQAIAIIIEMKFGEAGQRLTARVGRIRKLEALQRFMEKLKHAQSLSEAEKIFDEIFSNGHANNGANGRTAAKTTAHRGQ
jgi:predicted transposase YdaD